MPVEEKQWFYFEVLVSGAKTYLGKVFTTTKEIRANLGNCFFCSDPGVITIFLRPAEKKKRG